MKFTSFTNFTKFTTFTKSSNSPKSCEFKWDIFGWFSNSVMRRLKRILSSKVSGSQWLKITQKSIIFQILKILRSFEFIHIKSIEVIWGHLRSFVVICSLLWSFIYWLIERLKMRHFWWFSTAVHHRRRRQRCCGFFWSRPDANRRF